ncbi:hypothetical protein GCM10027089_10410 [Nocardia thraciensis]
MYKMVSGKKHAGKGWTARGKGLDGTPELGVDGTPEIGRTVGWVRSGLGVLLLRPLWSVQVPDAALYIFCLPGMLLAGISHKRTS